MSTGRLCRLGSPATIMAPEPEVCRRVPCIVWLVTAGNSLQSVNTKNAIVYVVDDDPLIQQALDGLIRSAGLRVQTFASAREFLHSHLSDAPACLVLDVRLPGQSGLELQRELTQAQISIPIIFITGHGDIPMSVQALKAGAVDFLTK